MFDEIHMWNHLVLDFWLLEVFYIFIFQFVDVGTTLIDLWILKNPGIPRIDHGVWAF